MTAGRQGATLAACALGLVLAAAAAKGAAVSTEHVTAELVVDRTLAPGESAWAGLHLRMQPGWHTYWKNPGDAGEPTKVVWQLPPGWKAGAIRWPRPELIAAPPLASFGYGGETLLLAPLTAPADARPGAARLVANVRWVACAEVCIPETARLTLDVQVAPKSARDARVAPLFASAHAAVPGSGAAWQARASGDAARLVLRLRPPAGTAVDPRAVHFFPAAPSVEPGAAQRATLTDGTLTLELVRSRYAPLELERLAGVLVAAPTGSRTSPLAIEIDAPLDVPPPSSR